MDSPSPPQQAYGDMDDGSRVLVDGPGNYDTKQGAKIACLECRSAKIKCSAPTDGVVPCKRCVKHQRECLFEKHKRGRKPNKRFSVPSDLRAEMHMEGSSYSPQTRVEADARHRNIRATSEDESGDMGNGRHRYDDGAWQSPLQYSSSTSARPSHYAEDRYHTGPLKYERGVASPSIPTSQTINQPTHIYSYTNQPHAAHHHHVPHAPYQNNRHAPDIHSPGRWRSDHPSRPRAPSPHGPQSSSQSYPSNGTVPQHENFAQARSRSYVHNAPAPKHSYAQWDSQLATERALKLKHDMSPSRHSDQQPSSAQHSSSSHPRTSSSVAKDQERSSSKNRASVHRSVTSSRSRGNIRSIDEDMDDEQDELEDDADATREEHDNVLSNPLKLLAQASDAAAARIEGGRVDLSSRNSLAAVETMGLLHPSAPSSRMAVSAAVNLTGLGRPLYGRREDDARLQRGWPTSRMLPPIMVMGKQSELSDVTPEQRAQMPLLRDSGRSKSFPAGELPRLDPATIPEMEDVESQSASTSKASGTYLGRPNILTPSTLDHDAWEYREGKAQARRGYGSGASPGVISGDAVTTGSSTSTGVPKHTALSNAAVAASGELIESPAEEVTTAMLGKRKRGRSRLAQKSVPSRRRKLAEWDTDAENGDGEDDDGADPDKSRDAAIAIAVAAAKDSGGITSGGEGEAGASRKGYFKFSLFHSKNDDTEGIDPVELGLVELKELERLFDIFFARINPVLDLFDPFLHSVAFVRMRSAFLTTVISCMAARFSDTPQDAHIAAVLDKHWQEKLLPMILLGGYKSVEISQAFLILTTYSRPTNRLVDDRSWQYLGFAIRTATEVGVNRRVTPSENLLGNEQVSRRVRNRERLWYNLFLYDRTLSAQTGRPWTITEDRMIVQSSMWHRQDFALPEDVSLVSLIKLRRITAQHTEAFDTYLSSADRFDETQTPSAMGAGQNHFDRRLAGLEFFRKMANADLEKWKETWCINTEEKVKEVDTSTAAGKYLVRWAPTAKLFYYHSRLLINSLVLGATEQYEEFLSGSSVSVDCWTSANSLIDTVLNDFSEEAVVTWSNDRVVMAVYAAVSSVRMTNLRHKYAFADKVTLLTLVRRLAISMTQAGKTPRHRNGSATPYGRYLKSVLAAFEPDKAGGEGASSQSAVAKPSSNEAEAGVAAGNSGVADNQVGKSQAGESDGANANSMERVVESEDSGPKASSVVDALQLQPDDVISQISAGKTLDMPLLLPTSNILGNHGTSLDSISKGGRKPTLTSASVAVTDKSDAGRKGPPLLTPPSLTVMPVSGSDDGSMLLSNAIATSAASLQTPTLSTGAAAGGAVQPIDDPESLERIWDYMTAFEHTSFWQPQSTWNMSGNAPTPATPTSGAEGGGGSSSIPTLPPTHHSGT